MAEQSLGFFGGLSSGLNEGQTQQLEQRKQQAKEELQFRTEAQKNISETIQHIGQLASAAAASGQDPQKVWQNPSVQTMVQSAQSLAQKYGLDPERVGAMAQSAVLQPTATQTSVAKARAEIEAAKVIAKETGQPIEQVMQAKGLTQAAPAASTAAPGETAMLDPETLKVMVQQYRAGDTSVLTNLGRGKQGAANVVAFRKEHARQTSEAGESGADQANRNAEYQGTKASQRTLGTRTANIELAATEFEQVVPVVAAASKAVDRTQYPALNKIIQAAQEGTGDPKIVAFGGGINTLVNLYARAISPTGQPTVSDKDHAREVLQKAWSQGQFDAAVGMMRQEVQAALNSPDKVREEMRKRFLKGSGGKKTEEAPAAAAAAPDVVDWRTYFGAK